MSKKDEALKLALEALKQIDEAMPFPVAKLAQKVIREALAEQPAPVAEPLTDEEIESAMPSGIYDCLADPWDCGVGDGDEMRSIKKDVVRITRAIEAKLREKNA